jgi:hypothetical protein
VSTTGAQVEIKSVRPLFLHLVLLEINLTRIRNSIHSLHFYLDWRSVGSKVLTPRDQGKYPFVTLTKPFYKTLFANSLINFPKLSNGWAFAAAAAIEADKNDGIYQSPQELIDCTSYPNIPTGTN